MAVITRRALEALQYAAKHTVALVIESDHSRKTLKALQHHAKKTVDRRLRVRGQFLGSVGVLACGEAGTVPINALLASEMDDILPPELLLPCAEVTSM